MSKRFAYILKSADSPARYYTGITADVAKRHALHNAGCNRHTAKYRPWSVDVGSRGPRRDPQVHDLEELSSLVQLGYEYDAAVG